MKRTVKRGRPVGSKNKPNTKLQSYAQKELDKRRQVLREQGKTDKDIERIEKTMLNTGIMSHEKASEYLEWMDHAKKPTQKQELERLAELSERQDAAIAQATDQIADLQGQVEFYRKQVNHFLALLNILAKGS